MVKQSEQLEFSDMARYSSDTALTPERENRNGGCYVSTAVGFVLLLFALIVALGVGLIVHFAGPQNIECGYGSDGVVGEVGAIIRRCEEYAAAESSTICRRCPGYVGPTTQSPDATDATTTPKPKINVRIPLDLYPLHYTIDLKPDMYGEDKSKFTFEGYVNIRLNCTKVTNKIHLHIKKITINNDTISFVSANSVATPSITSYTFDEEREFVIFHLSDELIVGDEYDISMNYTGPLKSDLKGLYLSEYKRDNKTVYIATSQLQPTDARKTFPCFDEPAIKAAYDVTLQRKEHMKSLSNMPIKRTDLREGGWKADVYETSAKMSTYLLAFVVCDFEYLTVQTDNNVTYNVWARPSAVNQANYSLDVGNKVLTYFETYFNISFPLPKQDMIAVPDFAAGAMENWGLIIYRETAMLYEPGVSAESNKQRVAVVVAHELAHQWFGNLVTPSWWDDLWLNEGFATYMMKAGIAYTDPDWLMFEQFVGADLQGVMNQDSLVSSHPVYVPVSHPNEINEIFDGISYNKGASIIRMMQFFVGENTFKKGLENYLNGLRYGAAFHDDLWEAVTQQTQKDGHYLNVKEIMDTWTLQMNFPVVKMSRTVDSKIRITQKRFLLDSTAPELGKYTSPFGYKWEIPITWTHSAARDFTNTNITWLHKNQDTYDFEDSTLPDEDGNSWIIGNVGEYGYYRVNYENSNWRAILKQLEFNHTVIGNTNRAQIINDAWNLAKADQLDQEIAMETLQYLDKETDFVPWVAATREITYVKRMLQRTPLYGKFMKFLTNKVNGPFASLGGMNITGKPHLQTFLLSLLAKEACDLGISECVNPAKTQMDEWKRTGVNNISPDLKVSVYCAGVASGDSEMWDFVFEQAEKSNVASEKSTLLRALGCSQQVWVLSRYLEYTLDSSKVRNQDAAGVIAYVAANPIGRSLAWDFVRSRYEEIFNMFSGGAFNLQYIFTYTTQSFNAKHGLLELETFKSSAKNLGSAKMAIEHAIESTKSNIKWMDKNYKSIKKWLESKNL